ncbi:mucin-5AC-like [Homarus americanus]|uniref:mucin-5AC-like n=1 Tax=Homarus americanus TaxID=6706 RepID=UPI001C49613E|nr:mucin-5AC-like [Homarus americanus]
MNRSSVYSSSSYAASRGYRRPSGGDGQQIQPVAPPRSKATPTSSSLAAAGVMKSSSEIFSSSSSFTPSKGILKSSSGILKTSQAGEPLSRSASGGTLPFTTRVVNFSNTVSNIDDPLPTTTTTATTTTTHATVPAASTTPPSETSSSTGPTGRTLSRHPEDSQQQGSRRKIENTPHPLYGPRTQHPQQKDAQTQHTQQKGVHYPQPREAVHVPQQVKGTQHPHPKEIQQQQRGTQHLQQKDVTKINDLQLQQIKFQQQQQKQQEAEDHDSKLVHPIKTQQKRETAECQENQRLRQQQVQQLQREGEKQEALKQQQQQQVKVKQVQKTPRIDIPVQKHRAGEEQYYRDQHYQQLIRAGSLGSGEPAAILEQRRSRSPLPIPGRAQPTSDTKGFIPPITSSSSPRSTELTGAGKDRKNSLTKSQEVRGPFSQESVNVERSRTVDKGHTNTGRSPDGATKPASLPYTGTAAAGETRTDVIRAAAKAYTENFQTYSFSGYLTKNRKDSTTAKESPVTTKENIDISSEVKLPPAGTNTSHENEAKTNNTTVTNTYNSTAKPYTRGTAGKIIVPLTSFVPASKSSEVVTNLDKIILKDPLGGDREQGPHKPSTTEVTRDASTTTTTPATKPAAHKPTEQTKGKTQTKEQTQSNTQHQQQQPRGHHHKEQPTKPTREKTVSSGNSSNSSSTTSRGSSTSTPTGGNKKPPKILPPLLSGLKFPLGGDKMKGSSEGALLVVCRVGEEDQVVRLLKELTATGALEATEVNQADRSGRTPLSYSCANAFQRVVETLTALSGVEINKPDTDGNTPLHYAAQAGHTEVVSHLVNKCNRSVDLDARNALGFLPHEGGAAGEDQDSEDTTLCWRLPPPSRLRAWAVSMSRLYTGRHVSRRSRAFRSHAPATSATGGPVTPISSLTPPVPSTRWAKIKKAFHKSESKKEFSVVTNLSTMAVCATSPLLPTAVTSDLKPHQVVVPHVQTKVNRNYGGESPRSHEDPEDALSRLPPPPPPPILPPEEAASTSSASTSSKSPKKQPAGKSSASSAGSPPSSPPASSSPPSSAAATSSSASKPSSPPSSPSPHSSGSDSVYTSCRRRQAGGDSKTNGAAKTVASSSKASSSSTKKRK